MHYNYGPMFRYGNMFLVWLIPLILLLLIGLALYMIFRKDKNHQQQSPDARKGHTNHAHSALEILNERYARGEIDDDEYQRRKQKLLE